MTDTHDNELEKVIQTLGDLCHEKYTGCQKTDRPVNEWDYCYTDEVINMLDDPRVRTALTHWRDKAVLAELEKVVIKGGCGCLTCDAIKDRAGELRAKLSQENSK